MTCRGRLARAWVVASLMACGCMSNPSPLSALPPQPPPVVPARHDEPADVTRAQKPEAKPTGTAGKFAVSATYTTTNRPSTLAAHDLDGDGDLDIVVAQDVTAGGLDIFRNKGDGTYSTPPTHIPAGSYTWGVGA